MSQCPSCHSYNDDAAGFCGQCGERLPTQARPTTVVRTRAIGRDGTRRRTRVASALIGIVLVALVFVLIVADGESDPAPAGEAPSDVGAPAAVSAAAGTVRANDDSAAIPEETTPDPGAAEPAEAAQLRAARALVVLELRDERGRPWREVRGVLIDRRGIVLCRWSPLLGAVEGEARLLADRGDRMPITGVVYSNAWPDCALVHVEPRSPVPGISLRPTRPEDGDAAVLFYDHRPIAASVGETDVTGADGRTRVRAVAERALPPGVFLAVDDRARVVGLCRPDDEIGDPGLVATNGESSDDRSQARSVLVDPVGELVDALDDPALFSLQGATERFYRDTFADLYRRGREAIVDKRWTDAIDLFARAVDAASREGISEEDLDRARAELREAYFREAERRLAARRLEETEELLSRALEAFETDVTLWRMLGDVRSALGLHADAIAAYLAARDAGGGADIERSLEDAYLALIRAQATAGDIRGAELSLVDGIEQLPGSAALRIELAKIYIDFDAYDDAVQLLNTARELDPKAANVVETFLSRIDDALRRRDAVIIPIESSSSLRARALVDGRENVTFVIDTGATYTAIPLAAATRLGYDVEGAPRRTVRTASGLSTVPVLRVESVDLEGYAVRNLEVLVLPTNGPKVGLLGLNYLNHFRYSVDSARREFRLERQ